MAKQTTGIHRKTFSESYEKSSTQSLSERGFCECEEEAAGVLQYDGEMTREQAEALAPSKIELRCVDCPKILSNEDPQRD